MTKNEIRCLVDKLGFKISYLGPERYSLLMLYDKKTEKPINCYNEVSYRFIYFSNYEVLAKELLGYIYKFQVGSSKKFKNPCLGCKSFEEACVKIDFLCNEY